VWSLDPRSSPSWRTVCQAVAARHARLPQGSHTNGWGCEIDDATEQRIVFRTRIDTQQGIGVTEEGCIDGVPVTRDEMLRLRIRLARRGWQKSYHAEIGGGARRACSAGATVGAARYGIYFFPAGFTPSPRIGEGLTGEYVPGIIHSRLRRTASGRFCWRCARSAIGRAQPDRREWHRASARAQAR
jgi:hypothetical protein